VRSTDVAASTPRTMARATQSAAAVCRSTSSRPLTPGRAPVARANTVSPSNAVCTGDSARANPSWATPASLLHPALERVASVATTASVVAVPARNAATAAARASRYEVTSPASGVGRSRSAARWAASIRPSGPNGSPTALTTTSAPTVTPEDRTADAVPTPPRRPPVRAPVPAPTEPCSTGPAPAAAKAAAPSPGLGWFSHVPPRPRSNRIAAGTIGTRSWLPGPTGHPRPAA
jgi:hypothetical protein